MSLVPSKAIFERVRRADSGYTHSRLAVLERLPGNPVGVESRQLGRATAFQARCLPIASFNRVVGLTDAEVGEIAGLLAWYRDADVAGRFEIDPDEPTTEVAKALHRAGYFQSEFHAVLFGEPPAAEAPPDDVSIEVVDSSRLEHFLEAYAAGWGVPDVEGFKANVRGWLGQTGWALYLALRDGSAAGGAILYVAEGVGYCADAAVIPAMRGGGAHQALLRRRMADALSAGCDLVCAKAAFLSTSHRNMVRAGFDLLCSQAVWTAVA